MLGERGGGGVWLQALAISRASGILDALPGPGENRFAHAATVSLLACAAALAQPLPNLRDLIERYTADRGSLERLFQTCDDAAGRHRACAAEPSAAQRVRMKSFHAEWLARLDRLPFEKLDQGDRIDAILLRNHLDHELRLLDREQKELSKTAALAPFAEAILALEQQRRAMQSPDPAKAAASLDALRKDVEAARKDVESRQPPPVKFLANRAAEEVDRLRAVLRSWFGFYNGYDPVFTWWAAEPYRAADKALQQYAAFLREKIVGLKPDDRTTIVGNPIGREALEGELAHELIPYSPDELIDIANREFAWCEAEMKKASGALGYGDDWHKALEFVKTRYVEPGKQPALIHDLALQAIDFVSKRDLVTIPPLVRETWRMEMMSPERQLVNPFFTGGEVISVSYPTNTMTQEQKLMSMRGNNIYFAHATVFHELIPGHYLQQFMEARYRPYRRVFATPFLTEGWALYWEMLLWDLGFDQSPEDRVGALFWRMHRAARIIFSLGFHLGKMTPEQCIDFLVNRVGHERENAAAEVRRSFNGSYSPLYQTAYMLGGLQLRALHRELVDSGRMSNRAFHDAVLEQNCIPIELIRASLTGQPLRRDFRSSWRFY